MERVLLRDWFKCGTKGTLRTFCTERHDVILRHVYYCLTSPMQNGLGVRMALAMEVFSGTDISPCVLKLTQWSKQTKEGACLIAKLVWLMTWGNTRNGLSTQSANLATVVLTYNSSLVTTCFPTRPLYSSPNGECAHACVHTHTHTYKYHQLYYFKIFLIKFPSLSSAHLSCVDLPGPLQNYHLPLWTEPILPLW